ncbi:MAG TPA: hypothetical protein VM884_04890 [Flavisolibacter sp.]|jgi:hypothetical protein|nr:hypothetical protein [Flavisolibacter sp.]
MAAAKFASRTLPIELINAERFYDALKLVQKRNLIHGRNYSFLETASIKDIYYYDWDTPRNSL